MSELLPCPFCGTKAVSPVLDHNQGMKWGAVECDGCCAKGPEVRTDYTENGPWVEKAKEEWNSRHVPEGWQLVPVEPTREMMTAGAIYPDSYADMLAAAPKPGGGDES